MFTLEEVKKAVGGKLISKTDEIVFATSIEVKGVSTDTRTIKEGELFIALKGENFDGNDYLAKAFELGASALVTNDEKMVPEGANAIIADIITGISKTEGKYEVEPDRSKAIKLSINMAKEGDTVLIAGKGHEDYQIFADKTIHFDDCEHARNAVIEREGK